MNHNETLRNDCDTDCKTIPKSTCRRSVSSIAFCTFLFTVAKLFIFYGFGSATYFILEGWDLISSAHFITQSITTVGYGNIVPVTFGGRMFSIFYILIGILLFTHFLGEITSCWCTINTTSFKFGTRNERKRNKLSILMECVMDVFQWIFGLFLLLTFGATIISWNEDWPIFDALYFTVVTSTSVGFGDLVLTKTSSIWFNVVFILISVVVMAKTLDKISNLKQNITTAQLNEEVTHMELSPELLFAINKQTVAITRSEYVLHMLQLAGKLDKQTDIDPWVAKFAEFDMDRDGVLTMNDVRVFEQQSASVEHEVKNTRVSGNKQNQRKSGKKKNKNKLKKT